MPFAPTAFESAGESHLVYELYLTNFSGSPVNIQRIEVLDADAPTSPIAEFGGDKLPEILAPVGGQGNEDGRWFLADTQGDGQAAR